MHTLAKMGLQKHQCERVQELAWKNTRHVLLPIFFNTSFSASTVSHCLLGHCQPCTWTHVYMYMYPGNSTGWRLGRIYESVATWLLQWHWSRTCILSSLLLWYSQGLGCFRKGGYFSNLLKDSRELWLIAWNIASSKHAQLEITAAHEELEDVWLDVWLCPEP